MVGLEGVIREVGKSSFLDRFNAGIRAAAVSARLLVLLGALAACDGSSSEKNKECEESEDCVTSVGAYCDDNQCAHDWAGQGVEDRNLHGERTEFYGITDANGLIEFQVGDITKHILVVDENERPVKHAKVNIFERDYSLGFYAVHPDFNPYFKIVDKISPARTSHDQYKMIMRTSAPWRLEPYPNEDASARAFNDFSTTIENPDSYVRCVSTGEMMVRYDLSATLIKFALEYAGGDVGAVISKAYESVESVTDVFQEAGYLEDPFTTFCANGQQYTHIPHDNVTTSITMFVCQERIEEEILRNGIDDNCNGEIDEDCSDLTDERVCVGNSIYELNVCGEPANFLADCRDYEYCVDAHCECFSNDQQYCTIHNSIITYDSCGHVESEEFCDEGEHCVQEGSTASCVPGAEEEPECHGTDERYCASNRLYTVDSCGNTILLETCSSSEECIVAWDGSAADCVVVSDEPEECEPTDDRRCSGDGVYSVDSCGNLDELIEHCEPSEECRSGGYCVPRTDCEPHDSRTCHDGNVHWVDSCDVVEERYDTCSTTEACIDAVCVSTSTGGKIAFNSLRDGNMNIYTMNADGTGQTRITDHEAFDGWPAWSPNGRRIAFVSERTGSTEIHTMDGNGSYLSRITDHGSLVEVPVWSPAGDRIAFTAYRDGNAEIYVIGDSSVGEYEIGTNITNNSSYDGEPSWSPSGTELVFVSDREGTLNIYRMNADGTNVRRIIYYTEANFYPNWSPDGDNILYTGEVDGQFDVFKWNISTGRHTRLTTDSTYNGAPVWSPDGTKIAFMSNRTGNTEIWVMNSDGSDQTNITNSPGFDGNPTWTE